MTFPGGIALTAVSLLAGWIGLWPLRHRLGAAGYHLCAYPIGLLGWPLATALGSVLELGFHPIPLYAAVVVALFAASWALRSADDEAPSGTVTPAGYLAWGAAVIGLAAAIDLTGYTSALYDSVFHYERWGTWLTVRGSFQREIIESYGAFIPSVHAANRYLGGDWASTPYPVLSLHVAATFAVAVRAWTKDRVGPRASWGITGAFVLLLVTTPRYLHHSLYVHGHMFTAAYLLLAMYAAQRAYLPGGVPAEEPSSGRRVAWLLVAGLAGGGMALARADGIAYVLVVALTATLMWWEGGFRGRDQLVYVAAMAAPIAVVYGSAFATLRFWRGGKLTGKRAAVVLGTLGSAAGATLVVGHLGRLTAWFRRGRHALLSVLALEAAAALALVYLRADEIAASGANMMANLLRSGGNGHLWWVALGAIAVSLLYGGQWRSGRLPGYLLFAVFQFFLVAVFVHSWSHVGRLSANDSFNRVSFHVIPLVFWYAATVVTTVVAELAQPHGALGAGADGLAAPPGAADAADAAEPEGGRIAG